MLFFSKQMTAFKVKWRREGGEEEEQSQPWSRHHSRSKLEGNRIASIITNVIIIGTFVTAVDGMCQVGTQARRVRRSAANMDTRRASHATMRMHISRRATIHQLADGTKICYHSRDMNGANDY